MKQLWLIIFLSMMCFSACVEELNMKNVSSVEKNLFTATFEDGVCPDSRTAMTRERDVVWSKGDQLAIFMGSATSNKYQVTDDSAGSREGKFDYVGADADFTTGDAFDGNVAFYPHSTGMSVESSGKEYVISGVEIPQVQTYVAGTFTSGAFPVAAVTESLNDYELKFKNVCGVLKLSLVGMNAVRSITVSGKAGQPLSGEAVVRVGTDRTPLITMDEEASYGSVILYCDEPVQLDPVNETSFLIVLPPVTFADGFNVEVKYSGGAVHKIESNKSNVISRSRILAMPVVELPYLEDGGDLLLDMQFNADGSAQDYSSYERTVQTFRSPMMFNYYNESYGGYMAHFGNESGASVTSGFYKIDYSTDADMKASLADGFSVEVLFKLNELPTSNVYSSLLSSVQGSGFGLCLYKETHEIRFEIKTSDETAKTTLHSGYVPAPGEYCHVVATWDKDVAKIYVNGEYLAEASAKGDLLLPTEDYQWIGIGADPAGKEKAATAFCGDIAVARVYDSVLSSNLATKLYKSYKSVSVAGEGLLYNIQSTLAPGCSYYIYEDTSVSSEAEIEKVMVADGTGIYECQTKVVSDTNYGNHMVVTLPDNVSGSDCGIHIFAGGAVKSVGPMTLGASPMAKVPGVFAHRCNGSGTYQENSLKGLEATQKREKDGITGAEFDVWLTTDGKVVVYHDSTIKYGFSSWGWTETLTLEKSTYSELKKAFDFERMTLNTLDEFLDQGLKAPNVILNFEIKEHSTDALNIACAEAVATRLISRDMVSQCRVMSYSTVALNRLKELVPTLKIDLLTKSPNVSTTVSAGYAGISAQMDRITSTIVNDAHASGLQITSFTPSTESQMMRLINLGVDFVTVNNVDMALKLVNRPYISE